MTKHQTPRRQRKGDRLTDPTTSEADVGCDYAIGPLDRLALEMDEKWGIDRLPELVSPATAERYGKAIAQLNAALANRDPKTASHKAAVCMKGLRVMDAEAEANGAPKASGDYWEHQIGPFKFAVLKDAREWRTFKANRPDLAFYTLQEIGLALKAYAEVFPIEEVKAQFPAAQIRSIEPVEGQSIEDDIGALF